MARLYELYKNEISNNLKEKFSYSNVMEIPKLKKIVLNMGLGDKAVIDKKHVQSAQAELSAIAGQKAVITKAKKSIAAFKLREQMPIGSKVTLRGKKMYEFLDRLNSIALPRVRDFRGIKVNGFDRNGNYNMGLKEQIIFLEVDYDKIDSTRGLDISFVTSATKDEEAYELLKAFNLPFMKSF